MSDSAAGISRVGSASKGFRYRAADGTPIRDRSTLERIRALAIPPAWTDVWICALGDGHLQATGRDARGRKQYRYHARWREVRDEAKYGRLLGFARALPRIRRRIRRDLRRPGLTREKVLAATIQLLEGTLMRVGNEEYARKNGSFGLTTLRAPQVRVDGAKLSFRFRGKSGVSHALALTDQRLSRVVQRMKDLPGYALFQYIDANGSQRTIGSEDVNEYLREISGQPLTSKDFRTWAGTVLCARALGGQGRPASTRLAARNVARAFRAVAQRLGNTPAVCRKCYVHPLVIERYLDGTLDTALRGRSEESALIALLTPGTGARRLHFREERSRPRSPTAGIAMAGTQFASP